MRARLDIDRSQMEALRNRTGLVTVPEPADGGQRRFDDSSEESINNRESWIEQQVLTSTPDTF